MQCACININIKYIYIYLFNSFINIVYILFINRRGNLYPSFCYLSHFFPTYYIIFYIVSHAIFKCFIFLPRCFSLPVRSYTILLLVQVSSVIQLKLTCYVETFCKNKPRTITVNLDDYIYAYIFSLTIKICIWKFCIFHYEMEKITKMKDYSRVTLPTLSLVLSNIKYVHVY